MPEITYNWVSVGSNVPWMQIHKKNGNFIWSASAYQAMGYPTAVDLCYDEATNSLGIRRGVCFGVIPDEGNYKIDSKSALEECGLEFPLEDNIQGTPICTSGNLLIFSLG